MPFVTNQGVRIHYETVGGGPPLLLHHGTAGSCEDWVELGYVDALKPSCQVISMDSRGHGQSDKPHDPGAYDLALRTADVVAVLDHLKIPKAAFFGYSLGGWIGFGLAKFSLHRFNSFILCAAHPYAENMQAFRDLMPRDQKTLEAQLHKLYGDALSPTLKSRLMSNDLDALLALTQDRNSVDDVLPLMTMPSLLFVGELDPRFSKVEACSSKLPNATFFKIPGADHISSIRQTEIILPRVKTFLQTVYA